MEIRDSRRLPGPNLLWDLPSAVLDVSLAADEEVERFLETFEAQLRRMLVPLGWEDARLGVRRFAGGVSVALEAPIDALYAATEVNEWAFAATAEVLAGRAEPPLEEPAARLRAAIAEERAARRNMTALAAAARERGVACITDDEAASIGMGCGSRVFAADAIPDPETLDWEGVHDVPVAIVTGTNGKSTVVRLVGAMVAAAGRTAGVSSTDWVRVGDEVVERGDWSGPSGARRVLRDPGVETAVLETARGGLLRRGLGLARADGAAVLNVGEDHLGEWGVEDLAALVETKFVVARAVADGGALVLNADDPEVLRRGRRHEGRVVWFTLDAEHPFVRRHVEAGGSAAVLADGALVLLEGDRRTPVIDAAAVPIALGGAARHNVANALAAAALAAALGVGAEAIAEGLGNFGHRPDENPGRMNEFDLGGVRCLVDFAHNPHGMVALLDTLARLPKRRWAVVLGQAGDRDDDAIRGLARVTARARPDLVVLKEMAVHLRGRAPGEVVGLLADELVRGGFPATGVRTASDELGAVREALAWARPGDVLLLLAHAERPAVLALMEELDRCGWRPGQPLPERGD